jgi:Mn2+/Fe2+ NRAMP family transporter
VRRLVTQRDLAQASWGNLFAIYQLHSLLFWLKLAIAACDLAEVLGMALV